MPLLEISQLKKSFVAPDGSKHKVVDVQRFNLMEKAQVALAGESASGKTTFLNLIAGIPKPDSGTVTARHVFWRGSRPELCRGVAETRRSERPLETLSPAVMDAESIRHL
jgi:ABC-type sugar transport system ATPase subunit